MNNEANENADPNANFYDSLDRSLRELFDKAKEKNEVQFAMSLSPEFRGCQDPGWDTAQDAVYAFQEYIDFIRTSDSPIKPRIALAFYSHISEAAGFYETPKNMLRVAEGTGYRMWPFKDLVQKHKDTGVLIAPNANKILKNLAGHAKTIGLDSLANCFKEAFDPELRNGYAHADYVLWKDGIRLRKRNGGNPRLVDWDEFNSLFEKGINFFQILRDLVSEYMNHYTTPRKIKAAMNENEPEFMWTIYLDESKGTFKISTNHC